jgi:TetR/AcrR family transcriptional repressor of nem operon
MKIMRKKHSKETIIEVGQELIRQRGYTNTGIEDILKANNIPKGSFYNFFKSKEDYGLAVLDKYTDNQYDYMENLLNKPHVNPLQRLKEFYTQLIESNVSEGCKFGCLVGNMTQEMGGLNENISNKSRENLNKIISLIGKTMTEGQEKGEIRTDYSADELAHYVHNSFYGALVSSKAGHIREPFDLFYKMIFNFLQKT